MKLSIPATPNGPSSPSSVLRRKSLFASHKTSESRTETNGSFSRIIDDAPLVSSPPRMISDNNISVSTPSPNGHSSFRQAISTGMTQAETFLRRHTFSPQDDYFPPQSGPSDSKQGRNMTDAIGFELPASPRAEESFEKRAGEPQVYNDIKVRLKK